jgi:hypothetical protein
VAQYCAELRWKGWIEQRRYRNPERGLLFLLLLLLNECVSGIDVSKSWMGWAEGTMVIGSRRTRGRYDITYLELCLYRAAEGVSEPAGACCCLLLYRETSYLTVPSVLYPDSHSE